MKSIMGVINGSLLRKKDVKIIDATEIRTVNKILLFIFLISRFKNFVIRFKLPTIANTEANESKSILKFMKSDGKSGRIFGSLKYLIVESKMILLIDALNPLNIKKIIIDNPIEAMYPI